MFCTNCGSPNQSDRFCDQCGTELANTTPSAEPVVENTSAPTPVAPSVPQPAPAPQLAVPAVAAPGQKNLRLAWGLALLLGNLGVDRFYLGKIVTGIFKLLTLGGFGIWTFVDVIILAFNKTTDKNGQPLFATPSERKFMGWMTLPFLFVSFILWSWIYASISR